MKVSFLCTLLSCIAHGLWVDTQDNDYYAILGVRRTAGLDEIRSSYIALMLKLHPDKNWLDISANEKSAMINEAYHTLKEKFRRAQYDREHPSAGKWEGKYGQFAYNNFKRYSKYGQFAYNYFKRYATYILEFVVKGGVNGCYFFHMVYSDFQKEDQMFAEILYKTIFMQEVYSVISKIT